MLNKIKDNPPPCWEDRKIIIGSVLCLVGIALLSQMIRVADPKAWISFFWFLFEIASIFVLMDTIAKLFQIDHGDNNVR